MAALAGGRSWVDQPTNRKNAPFSLFHHTRDPTYQSIHYLVKLTPQRARLPEYAPFADSITEIQVRTILQHAWAEIEHDIQYKSASVIPVEIRRRFMSLSGMFEVADREFQAVQDADRRLTEEARSRVEGGRLGQVEITPDALKAFLDKRLGPDGRIAEYSYTWTARLLKKLGFRTLEQVETCIQGYDDDRLSRIASGGRQGQTTRFEYMLLAGMGKDYISRHVFFGQPWYGHEDEERLERFGRGGWRSETTFQGPTRRSRLRREWTEARPRT